MKIDFAGKRAIVADDGDGIGRAITLAFAEAGAGVSICARAAERLAATHEEICHRLLDEFVHTDLHLGDVSDQGETDHDTGHRFAVIPRVATASSFHNKARANLDQNRVGAAAHARKAVP